MLSPGAHFTYATQDSQGKRFFERSTSGGTSALLNGDPELKKVYCIISKYVWVTGKFYGTKMTNNLEKEFPPTGPP